MKNFNFKEKGITLIALVVTIIILLILAGVTISAVINNNGIMQGAKTAVNVTNYQAAKEALTLKLMDIQADCTIKEIDYNLENINTELLKDDNFTVELYYYKETGTIRNGLTKDSSKTLKGVVVSVKKYEQYHFLIGEKGELKGVLTNNITDDITEDDFEDIEDIPSTPSSQGANPVTPESYGDTVNYSVTNNGVNLNAWRIFYSKNNETYIINSGYIPNSSGLATAAGLATTGTHGVYSSVSREDLINRLQNSANWEGLLTTELKETGAKAYGSIDLETWVESWNAKGYTKIFTMYTTDTTTYSAKGYLIGTTNPPTTSYIDLSSTSGYSNTLFFPYTSGYGNCETYWLAAESVADPGYLMRVSYSGGIWRDGPYNYEYIGIRPVLKIKSNLLEKQEDGSWNILTNK